MLVETDVDAHVPNVQSGGTIDLYFALIDKYGTIVKTDNSSKLFLM